MQRKLIAFAVVAFVVGLGVGAAAASTAQPTEQTADVTANITGVDVEPQENQYVVYTDSDRVETVLTMDPDRSIIHSYDMTPGASAIQLPLNWSAAYQVNFDENIGYNPDGETIIEIQDEEGNTLDRTAVNISARLDR